MATSKMQRRKPGEPSSELGYRQNHHQIWCSWVSTGQAWSCLRVRCRYSLDWDQTTAHLLDTRCRCVSPHRMDPKDYVSRSKRRRLHLVETPISAQRCTGLS